MPETSWVDKITSLRVQAQELLFSPVGATSLAGITAALFTGAAINQIQHNRANIFPVIYSGVNRLDEGSDTEAINFYAAVNDMAMKVTEAWNKSSEAASPKYGGRYRAFCQELDVLNLSDFANRAEGEGGKLLTELKDLSDLRKDCLEAAKAFRESWDYEKEDNYTTVPVTNTWTDDDGNTHTETEWEEVYSDTDHYFTFYPGDAREAKECVETMLKEYSDADFYDGKLSKFTVPTEFNDKDAIKMTIFEDDKREVSDEEVEKYNNQWLIHARLRKDVEKTKSYFAWLKSEAPGRLKKISGSRQKYHYNTSSTSHSGPEGYQYSKSLARQCESIVKEISDLEKSISGSINYAKQLSEVSKNIRNVSAKEQKKVVHSILDYAVEAYLQSFPDSEIEMDQRVKHGKTALISIGVGALCAGLMYVFHPQTGIVY